jgi:hypothetical protein
MKVYVLLMFIVQLAQGGLLYAQTDQDARAYIEQYKSLAIGEQLRAKVPAAITLAQGIHESAAGKSELATKGNNHFGIKCKSNWTGETILHDDDQRKECFRKYTNAEQSYIDHSDFLKGSNRYHFLFDLDITDYAGWASGLKRAGYATNPMYVKRLTDLVEKYNLQQYTFEGISKSNVRPAEIIPNEDKEKPRNLTHVDDPSTYYKGLKGFWMQKGETLVTKALEKNIRYARLLSLNDLKDEPLQTDMFIFTEKKRRIGTEEFHRVKEGETMQLIAQKEAMLLANLYAFNNMQAGEEPEVGEKLALQYKSYDTPRLKQQLSTESPSSSISSFVKTEAPKPNIPEPSVVQKQREEDEKRRLEEAARVRIEEAKRKQRAEEELARQKIAEEERLRAEVERENQLALAREQARQNEMARLAAMQQQARDSMMQQQGVILDPEKARRIEALLNDKPIEGLGKKIARDTVIIISDLVPAPRTNTQPVEKEVVISPEVVTVQEQPVPVEVIPEPEVIPVQEQPDPEVIPEPIKVTRTYDEPGIEDSVKALKKKFDAIVYNPRPIRKKKVPVTDSVITGRSKILAPVVSEESKKPVVQMTNTGVRRNVKPESKSSSTKDTKKPAKANSKANAKSNSKVKKPVDNKKKATPAGKTTAKKKAGETKKPAPKKKSK